MGAREEEKLKMAVILKEVSRRLDVFGKELTVYRELEQDLERKIADLQSLLNISEPEKGDPLFLSKMKKSIQDNRRQLERSLDAAMIRLSEHQRLEPDIVPSYRKEVGLLIENLPMMDEFNPLVIHDLEPGHSLLKYIIIRRLGRTKIRRGSGNPTQIIQDSTKKYIPSWKQWEERTLTQFFDTDIGTEDRIDKALRGLLDFYVGQTRKIKGGKKGKK